MNAIAIEKPSILQKLMAIVKENYADGAYEYAYQHAPTIAAGEEAIYALNPDNPTGLCEDCSRVIFPADTAEEVQARISNDAKRFAIEEIWDDDPDRVRDHVREQLYEALSGMEIWDDIDADQFAGELRQAWENNCAGLHLKAERQMQMLAELQTIVNQAVGKLRLRLLKRATEIAATFEQ